MCLANAIYSGFGKSKVLHLSLLYQIFYCACNVFHRNVWIYTVLIKQINTVSSQTF